jgi:protein tyrosine/serine phosphatase
MANLAKETRRAWKRVTMSWRYALMDHSPDWARRAFGPTLNYLDMLFIDHGVFRLIYRNRHRLGAQAWRSAQPAPRDIKALARHGVRTIVNLRGERACGSFWLEEQACREAGLKLVNFQMRSRAAPSKTELFGARELLERIEYPALLHCKSGADRAGLMSVLYRHVREGVPIAEAKSELALRFGHIRQADTGVLDYFFERYLADAAQRPMPFFEWVEKVYDPDEVKRSFKPEGWANGLVNWVLRRE